MKVEDIITANIGPAPTKVCKSGKPDGDLPSSWLASCRSKGLRRRDSDKEHKIGRERTKVGHKMVKGKKYGGPLPDYSE